MPRWLKVFLHRTHIVRSPSLVWEDAIKQIDWVAVARAFENRE